MGEIFSYFKKKKNLINLLVLGILVLGIPIGVNLVRLQQIIKSRASVDPIVFTGSNVRQKNDGTWVATKPKIQLQLTSPLGPPADSSSPSASVRTVRSKDSFVSFVSEKLVKTAYAGHCEGDANAYNRANYLCSVGTYCVGNDVYGDNADGTHTGIATCPYGCSNGSCNSAPPPTLTPWGCSPNDPLCPTTAPPCTPTITCATAIAGTRCDELAYDNCSNFCGKGTQGCSTTAPPPPPTNDSWCTNGNHICGTIGADLGSCTLNGQSCRRYETYQCTTSTGVNYCGSSPNQDCRNCTSSGTQTSIPKPGTGTTPTGSAGTYTGTGWYGCSDWVSDNCPDKTRTCTTTDGKAGVLCHITCTACGSKANGQAFMSGACGGPTTSNPYCDPAGSGNMIGGICTWEACTAGNTTGATGPCNVTATLSSACTNCILKVKNAGGGDLYNAIKGFDHQRFDACSFEQVTSYWCTGLSAGATAECNSIKAGACVSACTGSGSAPVPSSGGGGPAPSGGGGAAPSPTSAATPTPTPAAFTTKFRIAENPTDLAKADWQDYTTLIASTPFDYTFKDSKPGQKFIFVQFMDSTGKTTSPADCPKCQAQIKLLGPDPTMKSCSLSFEGNNAVLNLKGRNFGSDKGTIKSGDTDLTQSIRSWKDDSIQAVLPNAPTGQVLPVTFANTDGQTGSDQCSSISQLALGAKVFCRAPASHDTENVEMVLVDETGKKMQQTVRIDKNGVVQGLTQRLEDGKRYMLSLKAPKSLRRNVPFTAGGGTISIPNFVLPIGDIFPLDGGDGTINALDKSELNREWNISGDATGRPGDFNQDGKINSIDWACMRYDYGQSDDSEPTVPPPPASSANSSASASPR